MLVQYLARNSEGNHFTKATRMKFKETGDFAIQYITAPLRHKPNTSLGFTGLISANVVNERRFICDLEITDITITLKQMRHLIQHVIVDSVD